MFPPSDTAPEKVTKSPLAAPWAVSVTLIELDPSVAPNVTSPAAVVDRIGVMSL